MSPYAALALAPLFWSGNFVLGKILVRDLPPFTLSAIRWTISAIILVPMVWRVRDKARIRRDHWMLVVILGLTGISFYNALLYTALRGTATITATLIQTTIPLVTLLLARIVLREAVSRTQWLGIAAAFLGVSWIVMGGDFTQLGALHFNRSDLLVVGCVILWATYTLGGQRLFPHYPPVVATFYPVLVGLCILYPAAVLEMRSHPWPIWTWQIAAALLYVGIFPGVVSYLLWNRGVAGAGAGRAAIFTNLLPVYAGVQAVTFLGEQVGAHHLVGAALIGTGVYLNTIHRKGSDPKGADPEERAPSEPRSPTDETSTASHGAGGALPR